MGAWGPGSFDNDDATDWIAELGDQPEEAQLLDALRMIVEEEGYLEAPECSIGMAAAEVVAAAKGAPGADLPDEAEDPGEWYAAVEDLERRLAALA